MYPTSAHAKSIDYPVLHDTQHNSPSRAGTIPIRRSRTSSMSSEGDNTSPTHLMPIAAVTGMYAFATFLLVASKVCGYVYRSFVKQKSDALSAYREAHAKDPGMLSSVWFQVVTGVISSLCYAYVVAKVNDGMDTVFDPFEILGVEIAANSTVVKKAYRSLSLLHHPDKGGDPKTFNMIALAYKALTDEIAKENFEKYGHPDGPQSQTLSFALPDWLLKPTGTTATVLVLLYIGMFISLIVYVVRFVTKSSEGTESNILSLDVNAEDMQYLSQNLSATSTQLDVLCHIATSPSSIAISKQQLKKYDQLLSETKKLVAPASSKHKTTTESTNDLLDGSGWADDDDEEEKNAAKKHEEEQRQREVLLKQASGNDPSKENVFEGLDNGAIGWKWVENVLSSHNVWPPKYDALQQDHVKFLEAPAVRRNIALLTGRLNSQILNNHPDLVKAASERLLDTRYFADSLLFRQRCGLLLEKACVKIAINSKSSNLLATVIEAMTMFKIGCPRLDEDMRKWFSGVMKKTYGEDGVPRLTINDSKIETMDEDEIANDDTCTLSLDLGRAYAESVVQYKVALCQKQGLDPRLALQGYREGWWIIISAKSKSKNSKSLFLSAQPLFVINPAQKVVKHEVKFQAPSVPGKYMFKIEIKSTEYIGADEVIEMEVDIVDKDTLPSKGDDSDDESESKKDK